MEQDLETPRGSEATWEDQIFLAKGDDVDPLRPVFTGDVFSKVPLHTSKGDVEPRMAVVLQHPCSMRANGVDLAPRLLVCEVRQHRQLTPDEWLTFRRLMPLSGLIDVATSKRHQAAMFDRVDVVASSNLVIEHRIACLHELGVDLLLQRWVSHLTRFVVDRTSINGVVGGGFQECELVAEWCATAVPAGVPPAQAQSDCISWLRSTSLGGVTLQDALEDPGSRSRARRDMQDELRLRYAR